jgi:hypothetical protein
MKLPGALAVERKGKLKGMNWYVAGAPLFCGGSTPHYTEDSIALVSNRMLGSSNWVYMLFQELG